MDANKTAVFPSIFVISEGDKNPHYHSLYIRGRNAVSLYIALRKLAWFTDM